MAAQKDPHFLNGKQLREALSVSEAQYHRLKLMGKLKMFEASPQLTKTVRYNRTLVDKYRAHEWTYARTFGARRGPRSVQVQADPVAAERLKRWRAGGRW